MTIHAALRHVTRYRYDRPVTLGTQLIRLRPAAHCRTPISSYALSITPDHFLNWQQDPFGNYIARVAFSEKTTSFTVEVNLVAEMVAINPFDFFLEPSAEHFPFEYSAALAHDLLPYRRVEEASPELASWLADVDREKPRRTLDVLMALNQRLSEDIRYVVRMEPGVQSPAQTLTLASGSCRDSGWLLVHILRHLGFAARFVSGYLLQLTADEKSLDGPSGPEADFCDLHAWAEVYVPGAGWIGLDPTSGLLAGEGHLPVACTPEPLGAAPVSGSVEQCEVEFDFEMELTRIVESPRVTKPYTDTEWAEINAVGELVDERLRAGDVRLTMGGEPTFVSLDDVEGEEWSTAADSPAKSALAARLIERLRARFAPTAVVQFGQGKWYPGEPLPRWAYGLFWRKDQEPMWNRPALIATEPSETPPTPRAKHFVEKLAIRLGVEPSLAQAAFEDPLARVLPQAPRSADDESLDRDERLERAMAEGVGEPACFILPIQAWQSRDGRRSWRSERWGTEGHHIFLIAGDSPAGLRLPLASLRPEPDDDPDLGPLVPFLPAPPLATRAQQRLMRSDPPAASTESRPSGSVRTALTVEPRDGFLYVFVPPLSEVEDYVALLGAVEEVAEDLEQPIRIEGYEPPPDHRIRSLRVTPDPGVIEVNVAPSASWRELVDSTEALYEEARLCRLTAEKFMLDGRHAGTGGGNHVVLGGPTPSDSAFLRRPDLLKSLVGYFNNHPSLSFLFSGLFIGPTSQAPRVDQARDDALYELQIAFDQVPARSEEPPPAWVVDRIFRDVLVDVTGNTHRTEICIDKLYSPDSTTGRQGLVEFRGFEMPPHARMSLAQGLLIRALVARFWEEPYDCRLQHWGTSLHDRFMLPCFVRQDFEEVIAQTREAGVPLQSSWFAPHFEFRFPLLGSVDVMGIHLELRGALEPWHVTGEHGVPGGTARYVDSSVERLQVSVTGFADARYALTCNGRRIPLQPTGTPGSFAAGVRYRAWRPPHCLHPTIDVHAPLVFDVVDLSVGRSVGGCSYHVGHPGGRNHQKFPVNALEAEGRRLERFSTVHHSGRVREVVDEPPNHSFPATLDLRTRARAH